MPLHGFLPLGRSPLRAGVNWRLPAAAHPLPYSATAFNWGSERGVASVPRPDPSGPTSRSSTQGVLSPWSEARLASQGSPGISNSSRVLSGGRGTPTPSTSRRRAREAKRAGRKSCGGKTHHKCLHTFPPPFIPATPGATSWAPPIGPASRWCRCAGSGRAFSGTGPEIFKG